MVNNGPKSVSINISKRHSFNPKEYVKSVRNVVDTNMNNCAFSDYVKNKVGVFELPNYRQRFSITGSFIVHNLHDLGVSINFFLKKEGRLRIGGSGKPQAHYTRGYRYLVALDPNLSVLQKLEILFEDLEDGMDFTIRNEIPINKQYAWLAPVLDYIKNTLVTLYNAYTHKEKLGELDLENWEYQKTKAHLLDLMKRAVYAYYSALVNSFHHEQFMSFIKAFDQTTLNQIRSIIKQEYREFKFSSRAIVRPEASHPLILAAFCHHICNKYQHIDVIVGLPSGATEVVCLIHEHIVNYYRKNPDLVLLPVSTHTTKDGYGLVEDTYVKFHTLFDNNRNDKEKQVLIIDDNSATGKSLDLAKNITLKALKNAKIKFAVSEADVIRIQLNLEEGRTEIVDRMVFNDSIAILPISKRLHPKNDMKELIELHVLSQYYYKKSLKAVDIFEKIQNEIISEAISDKVERIRPKLNETNAILEFKHTFLSNFYQTPIVYKGILYPTVEHAYLDQKYRTHLLSELSSSQIDELNEVFKIKGMYRNDSDFSRIFRDGSSPAGVVKRISTIIKTWNMEVSDWENKMLRIMIELQFEKYNNNPFIKGKLLSTGNCYLLEGNTWNDTYWGFCNNRGRNFLGRILMKVRDLLKGESQPMLKSANY
jgi:predicted NAD-dependent protein-ADP-ribosyltransferase YbiA (DUF1768 family)/hypoxanthine phosphoribosyltransferase